VLAALEETADAFCAASGESIAVGARGADTVAAVADAIDARFCVPDPQDANAVRALRKDRDALRAASRQAVAPSAGRSSALTGIAYPVPTAAGIADTFDAVIGSRGCRDRSAAGGSFLLVLVPYSFSFTPFRYACRPSAHAARATPAARVETLRVPPERTAMWRSSRNARTSVHSGNTTKNVRELSESQHRPRAGAMTTPKARSVGLSGRAFRD
jgi:hypothetical protein